MAKKLHCSNILNRKVNNKINSNLISSLSSFNFNSNIKKEEETKNELISFKNQIKDNFQANDAKLENGIIEIQDKGILIISGQESQKFLQDITTNDIKGLNYESNISQNTLFLNAKGKIMFKAKIINTKLNDSVKEYEYLLIYDKIMEKIVKAHLKLYKLKKKVEIKEIEQRQFKILYFNSNLLKSSDSSRGESRLKVDFNLGNLEKASKLIKFDLNDNIINLSFILNNIEMYFLSISLNKEHEIVENHSLSEIAKYNEFKVEINKMISAVFFRKFTDAEKIASNFPFPFNFDLNNYINYKKGCYIGQEIIQRTHFTGLVRKRIFPVLFDSNSQLTDSLPATKQEFFDYIFNEFLDLENNKENYNNLLLQLKNEASSNFNGLNTSIVVVDSSKENKKEKEVGELVYYNPILKYGVGILNESLLEKKLGLKQKNETEEGGVNEKLNLISGFSLEIKFDESNINEFEEKMKNEFNFIAENKEKLIVIY